MRKGCAAHWLDKKKKSTFFGGAAILAAGIAIVKIIGAIYKIPLAYLGGRGLRPFQQRLCPSTTCC
jgi:hypothetical protein